MQKRNKLLKAALLSLTIISLSGCAKTPEASASQSGSQIENMEETDMEQKIGEIRQLVPDTQPEAGEKAASLQKLCQNAQEALTQLNTLAEQKSGSSKAVKTAQKVKRQYSERINELCTMDFSTLSEEDLAAYYSEVSDIISAIRKAKDLF